MPRLPPLPTLSWTPEGFPRSDDIGDVYFSGDGLSEKRAVFLAGCGLPEAWANRNHFVIAELGLGAGLNLLATWDRWRRHKPGKTARLHFVSIEGALMSAADAARTHALWPELADLSALLLPRWPVRARGMQRIELSNGVTLTVMIDHVANALTQLDLRADAWFLDGFSPAKNPEMWTAETMQRIASLSAPGARLASYAVAGDVRRNLEAAGFSVEKKPGHGRKKERLEATLLESRSGGPPPDLPLSGGGTASRTIADEEAVSSPPPERGRPGGGPLSAPTALVIGAGVAGCWAARALIARNIPTTILDSAPGPASEASGNPLALVMPRLDATDTPTSRALITAFLHARHVWPDLPGAQLLDVRRLPGSDTERQRFQRLIADPPLDKDLLAPLDPDGLLHHDSIAIRPAAALPALIAGATHRFNAEVASISEDGDVTLRTGETLTADIVIVATGMGFPDIAGLASPPLEGRLGQLECAPSSATTPTASADGGYALEAFGQLVFGATFEPAPAGDPPITAAARAENLATLARLRPDIDASHLQLTSRAAVRATTPDRLPFAGRPPGVGAGPPPRNQKAPGLVPAPFRCVRLIGGLGARGFLWAPLLAELVVCDLLGEPSPCEKDVAALLDPDRFRQRALRRGSPTA